MRDSEKGEIGKKRARTGKRRAEIKARENKYESSTGWQRDRGWMRERER